MRKHQHFYKLLTYAVAGLLLFCLTTSRAEAQQADERLWATWNLESIEITVGKTTQSYTLEELLSDKKKLPRNLFTSLYFYENEIGVSNTESEFVSDDDMVSLKGRFITNNGTLIVTMYGEEPRVFTYTIEDDVLNIRYTAAERQFYLTYKLIAKNVM